MPRDKRGKRGHSAAPISPHPMSPILRFFPIALACLACVVPAFAQTPRVYLKFDGNLTDSSTAGLVTSVAASAGFTPTYAADRFNVIEGLREVGSGLA